MSEGGIKYNEKQKHRATIDKYVYSLWQAMIIVMVVNADASVDDE